MYYYASSDVKYCFVCNDIKYPRFYHCKYCNKCIYKLDHHCFFIDNCVGSHNQNYFLQMLFYVSTGLFFSLIIHLCWFCESILDNSKNSKKANKPIIIFIHFFFNFGVFMSTSLLFLYQIFLIHSNLTSLEYRNVIFQQNKPFKTSFKNSLELVFGKLKISNLILPIENIKKIPDYL